MTSDKDYSTDGARAADVVAVPDLRDLDRAYPVAMAYLRASSFEWRCRQAWHVEALGNGVPVRQDVFERFITTEYTTVDRSRQPPGAQGARDLEGNEGAHAVTEEHPRSAAAAAHERLDDLRLAVTEACNNAVVHAYRVSEGNGDGKTFRLLAECHGTTVPAGSGWSTRSWSTPPRAAASSKCSRWATCCA